MKGVKMVEVAQFTFTPSAGAVLADWGADVIKVEHAVHGDPQRGLRQTGSLRVEGDPNPNVEHANRGKGRVGSDIASAQAPVLVVRLVRRSDAFPACVLPNARRRVWIKMKALR